MDSRPAGEPHGEEKMQAAWVIDAKHPRHESSANKPEVLTYSQILMESHSS